MFRWLRLLLGKIGSSIFYLVAAIAKFLKMIREEVIYMLQRIASLKKKSVVVCIACFIVTTIILVVVAILMACSIVIIGRADIGIVVGVIIGLVLATIWVVKCYRMVGRKDASAQAVIARWGGDPKRVVGPGLCWTWWPIEDLRIFPTYQYQLDFRASEVHSKEDEGHRTAVMTVDAAIYIMWPRWNEEYHFPNGEKKSGKDILLNNTFFALPVDTESSPEIKDFLEQAVLDAIRRVMVERNHRQCREDKEEIEQEIKEYLLSEPGNPFKECGIPAENLDVSVTSIKFTPEMEKAFSAPEVGAREAEGEKAYLEKSIEVLIDKGVSPGLASMIARKGVEKGLSIGELMNLVITLHILGADLSKLFEK